MSSLNLLWPWFLLLLPLPWFLGPTKRNARSDDGAIVAPIFELVRQSTGGAISSKGTDHRWKPVLFWAIWTLSVLATCRPVWWGDPIEVDRAGRDLMLAVDISPSMQEQDMIIKGFQTTRLEAVKQIVSDFIRQRKGDRVGLILFGEKPYIQAPLTFDLDTVNTLLQEAMLGMAGRSTSIGDAIGLAVKRLQARPENSRVLILLTDGANTSGEVPPLKAAELAREKGIKIYTIGIGAEEMVRRGFFGLQRYNPSADLDEATLTEIADMTGGRFFRARSAPELEMVYEAVNKLEPVMQDTTTYRPKTELFFWLLALVPVGVGVLIAPNLVFRKRKHA